MKKIFLYIITALAFFTITTGFSHAKEVAFTQEDRERLIKLEVTVKEFKESVDKRFEQIDKRFEQIDKRFEEIDKRLDQLTTFLWIITGIFTSLTIANIGFAYWDRRTIIRRAKEEAIAEIEKEGRVRDLILALRELAKTDEKVAKILRQFNLL